MNTKTEEIKYVFFLNEGKNKEIDEIFKKIIEKLKNIEIAKIYNKAKRRKKW